MDGDGKSPWVTISSAGPDRRRKPYRRHDSGRSHPWLQAHHRRPSGEGSWKMAFGRGATERFIVRVRTRSCHRRVVYFPSAPSTSRADISFQWSKCAFASVQVGSSLDRQKTAPKRTMSLPLLVRGSHAPRRKSRRSCTSTRTSFEVPVGYWSTSPDDPPTEEEITRRGPHNEGRNIVYAGSTENGSTTWVQQLRTSDSGPELHFFSQTRCVPFSNPGCVAVVAETRLV